tara:strand:+ start:474 stop:1373 length:900 start_codon:yes stop_codon:yes gene_type:complete
MGLLDNQNQNTYYTTPGLYGNYQFTTLDNIISAFMFSYVGESKIISKVNRTDVQFHAMRAIQELSYDVLRSIKSQEIELPGSLKMILPQDYVNYVKLTTVGSDGIEKNLYPTGKTSNPFSITQDTDGVYQYSDVDNDGALDSLIEQTNESNTWQNYEAQVGSTQATNATDATDMELDYRGRRYGLDPQHAHEHGSFYIDPLKNFIHFSSNLSGKTIILKYVSDGLGTDEEMLVHKFAEEAVYKSIAYGLLSVRTGIPEMIIQRFKREKFAETRKAKIRLSNIKIEEFTQVIKGMGKQIK